MYNQNTLINNICYAYNSIDIGFPIFIAGFFTKGVAVGQPGHSPVEKIIVNDSQLEGLRKGSFVIYRSKE